MKKVFSIIIFSILFLNSFSQETQKLSKGEPLEHYVKTKIDNDTLPKRNFKNIITPIDTGILTIKKDENFDLLLQEYLEQKKVSGYRIQLYAGNKRIDALKIKVDFMKLYPDLIPEIIYQQPNYKVRLGNFRNRLEATKDLQLYKIDFQSAFIIKDYIKL